ncbi:MAG: DUF2079 domain-containing protein [Thermoleophilia bacterium]
MSAPFPARRPSVELEPEQYRRLFRRDAAIVAAAMVVFLIAYSCLAWLRYRAYMDARFDLGNMVQAVFNTAEGRFLEITTGDATPRQMSRLGSHVDPLLALFALPWLVWPSPVMLLVGQVLAVGAGAWPTYRLGARLTRNPNAGALLAGAYLLAPATGFLVLNEFHPVALATPLLIAAFLYLDEEHWLRAAVCLVLAALCKETVPLVIAAMGAFFALRKRSFWPLVITGAAAVYFAFAVWVVIPHFNAGQSAFIARYGAYGDGAGEVMAAVLTHPVMTLQDLFSRANLDYWRHLLLPYAGLPLLSPLSVLIATPELLLNALSATPEQRRIEFQYTALILSVLTVATPLGLMRLRRWLGGGVGRSDNQVGDTRVGRVVLALLVLICSLLCNYFAGPLPLPGAAYRPADYMRTSHDAALDRAVALIPPTAIVSANNNAGAHLAARRVAYVFPYYENADWVLVDERHPWVFDKEDPAAYVQALQALRVDPRFALVFSEDGVSVFRRRD